MNVGLESIGIKIPSYAIHVKELAHLYNIPEEKLTVGLGCHMMGLCLDRETVVDLAVGAAKRALERWNGDPTRIGMVVVGTESSLDESRPLSAWVMDRLNLKGALRSYEVKHACYGGTIALRQAVEWKKTTLFSDKVALVIAADVCSYAPGHPAEPTQGAGAVAMIVGEDKICSINLRSYPYSEPCFDFWRPTGNDFPSVDGPESLNAYMKAVENCFNALFQDQEELSLEDFHALCFHVPFPKMVLKAFRHLSTVLRLSEEQHHNLVHNKILPYLTWNHEIGNAYTASLWICTAQALNSTPADARIACFSYGSGFGSELLTLKRNHHAFATWANDMKEDLESRELISIETYRHWQKKYPRRRGRDG